MDNKIDAVDYIVLKCLHQNGGCWKKRVYQWTNENIDKLPVDEQKSVQTIGRRIDKLHDYALVESCILSPDAVNRDMIIGYTLTEEGEEALEAKQNEFLREIVAESSKALMTADDYDGETQVPVDRKPLIALMSDAFDIDEETREDILPQIETEELLGLLATHFFLDNATFNPENTDVMAEFLQRTPAFRRPFEGENAISRIRKKVAATVKTGKESVRPSVS